jgi:hypothetical protein
MSEVTLKQMTDYILALGAADIDHSGKSYLAHAIGVSRDLEAWGCDGELSRAAVFHSIYGTEYFQKFTLPLERRGELSELIGERAERFAYWNCAMNRPTFDEDVFRTEGPYRLRDRFTEEDVPLSEADFNDVIRIHLCDWLEQVGRSGMWDYRREAYAQMAVRLGGIAEESYARVFGNNNVAS